LKVFFAFHRAERLNSAHVDLFAMSAIRLEGIRKSFAKGVPILSDLNLAVGEVERLAVVGPSGAGKTTLLRLIAGFEKPDAGRIFIGDREVTNLPPEQRDVAFVFQNHALYPHLTVEENLGFPLKLRGVARAEISNRVQTMAALLKIESFLKRRPPELSGGEAQRVALGRALIREPAALLMDEPLSSLPPDLRLQLRHELVKLHSKQPRPLLYVTHDHEDALALGQRVAVLHQGRFQQIGTPREIYERPANRFVASFIGKPTMNFLEARKAGPGSIVGIRPEHFEICDEKESMFSAKIEDIQYGGGHSDVVMVLNGSNLVVRRHGDVTFKLGDVVGLRAQPQNMHYFDQAGNRVES
jgi:ABC-type sugar transport system ATPase subunit